MYTYRIVLDAFNSRTDARSARVVTYSPGIDRADALRKIGTIYVAANGQVSDGFDPWPGSNALPAGPYVVRSLPEWDIVSIRSVPKRGAARIIHENETTSEHERRVSAEANR